MTLGARVKQLRTEAGLSQSELAQRIGYSSKTAISKIENDTLDINRSTVVALAKALNTTPIYLLGWENKDEPSENSSSERYLALSPKKKELFNLLLSLTPQETEKLLDYAKFLKSQK